MRGALALFSICAVLGAADDNLPLGERARLYLTDLVRVDTSNPPGNETRVADYLKQVADSHGIPCELVGPDPKRLNFVARLRGNGKGKPLLLMAHSDVVPADRAEWTADPFGGELRGLFLYGRGAQDDKSLLAAEMAVLVEIKRRNIKLSRDVILLSEADEEAGSAGIEWMIQHAWPKIDAEFALNEGGYVIESKDGPKVFQVQTTEKIPMRLVLTAKGTAAHGSIPRADNSVVHLAKALVKVADYDEPARLNETTRRYLRDISKLPEYAWLEPLRRGLMNPATLQASANQIRARDPEIDAMLRTTVVPTMLHAGNKNNVIPNTAEAQVDVRRMPGESREDVVARLRQAINDSAIDIMSAAGAQMPAAEPSSVMTPLYHAMERAIARVYPRDLLTPFMTPGATDGSFLRAKGMAVYGVPIFLRDGGDSHAHGNDERIATRNLEDGAELLWQIALETAGGS